MEIILSMTPSSISTGFLPSVETTVNVPSPLSVIMGSYVQYLSQNAVSAIASSMVRVSSTRSP